MLSKASMQRQLVARDQELQAEYRLACQGKSKTAEDITASSAAQIRHKCVRDRAMIALVLEVLSQSNAVVHTTAAIQGFEYLVNPTLRHRQKRATTPIDNKDRLDL